MAHFLHSVVTMEDSVRVFRKATGKNNVPPLESVCYIPWVGCTCVSGARLWPLFEVHVIMQHMDG